MAQIRIAIEDMPLAERLAAGLRYPLRRVAVPLGDGTQPT